MPRAAKVINMDDHRSSGPQLEDGYVRIANELFDAVLAKISSYRHLKLVLAIVRKTYGYGKKEDDITISQLAELMGVHRNNVGVALRELEEMRVINPVRAGRHGLVIGINKHHSEWGSDEVKTRGPGRAAIKLIEQEECNQFDCSEQSKQLPEAIKTIEVSNQNVAHNRQLQKTTPKDNSKREKRTPAAQAMPTLPGWMPETLWAEFVAYRKEIGKPVTVTVASRMLAKIERLQAEGHCPTKLIEKSILNRWTDVYAKPETLADKPGVQAGKYKTDERGQIAGLYAKNML